MIDNRTIIIKDGIIGEEIHYYCNKQLKVVDTFNYKDNNLFEFLKQSIEKTNVILGVHSTKDRKLLVDKIIKLDNKNLYFPNLLISDYFWTNNNIGIGNIVLMNSMVGINVNIGNFNFIDIGSIILPNSTIRDFTNVNYLERGQYA